MKINDKIIIRWIQRTLILYILEHIEDDLVYIETRLVKKHIESDDGTGSSSDEDSDYFDFEDGLIAKIEDVERHNDDEVFPIFYGTSRTSYKRR